jgi:hypothetical protein
MTGWAQVCGNTNLSLGEKLALDLWYIDHRNLWLDLTIAARTLRMLIGGERIDTERLVAAKAYVRERFGPAVIRANILEWSP